MNSPSPHKMKAPPSLLNCVLWGGGGGNTGSTWQAGSIPCPCPQFLAQKKARQFQDGAVRRGGVVGNGPHCSMDLVQSSHPQDPSQQTGGSVRHRGSISPHLCLPHQPMQGGDGGAELVLALSTGQSQHAALGGAPGIQGTVT